MRSSPKGTLLVFALLFLLSIASLAAGLRPVQLRCEDLEDPIAIDRLKPRLSWVLEASKRNQRQVAWQVLVADRPSDLAQDRGTLWDSDRVESSEQNQIEYGGAPLQANAECFWKVRAWDQSNRPGPWSRPARWRTALLKPDDWKAGWIGAPDAAAQHPLESCAWVWFPDEDPLRAAPVGARWFRKQFELPVANRIRKATMMLAVDNSCRVFVNGVEAGRGGSWETLLQIEVQAHLRPGPNLLAIEATNGATSPNPAGLIGRLLVELDDGQSRSVPIDGTWKCTDVPLQDWAAPARDDQAWPEVKVLGRYGIAPWNRQAPPTAPLPLFRHEFKVTKPVRRAVVHVTGLGHYDLFLDGRKVGDRFLDPAWSVFEKTVYYATFDVTEAMKPGAHAFGVMLGKGFYNTMGDRRVHGVVADRPLKLILQAHLTHTDGTETVIVSDGSWRATNGPITHSAILGGEDFDARRVPAGWDRPGFDDSAWPHAAPVSKPGGLLSAALAPPLAKHDVFKPAQIDEPKPGVFVYDFGQNASAVPRLRVRGQAGQVVRLTPAEQRHGMTPRRNDGHGLVNPAGVGNPNYFQYTLRGGASEAWTPQFTYTGFQYLQVEGAVPKGHPNPEGLPVLEELISIHVRNQARAIGRFACSEPLFNRIDQIIDWAVRANMSHVLTDCPHREKLGWLEVAYLMGPSIAGRYDLARFYRKVALDIADSQRLDGLVPTVAPAYPAFGGGFAYTPEWGAAGVIVPWQVHQWTGDRDVLSTHFDAMKRFVDYMERTGKDLVPVPGLGDWYDYGHGKPVGASQFTPVELSAMATFARCAQIVAEAAHRLGRAADQQHYADLAGRITRAFNERWFDGSAEYKNTGSPQCANSMALTLDLVPPGRESAVLERMIEDIRRRGNQQTAGDIGHWYLLQALGRYGRHDVIHDLTFRTNLGSYGFIVNNGWTSMPEAWDADTGASMNHCMLGHIQEWFLGDVAGIRPDPAAPGFDRFVIAPQPVGHLSWARGEYHSVRGKILSEWHREGDRFRLKVTIPANTTATIALPARAADEVREAGRSVSPKSGWRFLQTAGGRVTLEVGGGRYEFTSRLP